MLHVRAMNEDEAEPKPSEEARRLTHGEAGLSHAGPLGGSQAAGKGAC